MMKKPTGLQPVSNSKLLQQLAIPLTGPAQKLADASAEIALAPASDRDACFLHSVLCQVGMPRKKTAELRFERTNGAVSLLLTAGELWDGRAWVQQQLPYGPKPRMVLINCTTTAIVTKSRFVDVGRSTREFMERMGLNPQGSEYRSLRRQIASLAACRMQLGGRVGDEIFNLETQPIRRLNVWVVPDADQQTLWPGVVELSQEYFDHVRDAAVPLDDRAVAALRGTALGLDVYAWLAHRLWRIREPNGILIPWQSVRMQFGQEYSRLDHCRQEMRSVLKQVLLLYRGARVEEVRGGLLLRHSPPPMPRSIVTVR